MVAVEPHARRSAVAAAGSAASSEPPPPWWAPTYAADAGLRPGPTAFPPSGLGKPVVAGAGEQVVPLPASATEEATAAPPPGATHHLSTASGDPHPSDPDATRPVGLPPDLSEGGDGADGPTVAPDPDATTAMPTESSAPDPTAELPHPPDR